MERISDILTVIWIQNSPSCSEILWSFSRARYKPSPGSRGHLAHGRNRKWNVKREPISALDLKIVAGNVTNKFHSQARLLLQTVTLIYCVWEKIRQDKFLSANFLVYAWKLWQESGFVLSRDSKMPKMKGVESAKSHKKVRRKRPSASSASSVKRKGKLGNKAKKVCLSWNFVWHLWITVMIRLKHFLSIVWVMRV